MPKGTMKTSFGRGQTFVKHTPPDREKPISGGGKKASYATDGGMGGGFHDISHSISGGKVKKIGKSA